MLDFIIVALDAVGLLVAAGMSYYAFNMITQMKSGKLEKSWKHMTRGALIIAADVVVLMIQAFGAVSPLVVSITSYAGGSIAIVGGFFILLGFREQYRVWQINNPHPVAVQKKAVKAMKSVAH